METEASTDSEGVDNEFQETVERISASLHDTMGAVVQIMERVATAAAAPIQKGPLKVTLVKGGLVESLWPAPAAAEIDFESFIETVQKYTLETLASGDQQLRDQITSCGGWFGFLRSLITS